MKNSIKYGLAITVVILVSSMIVFFNYATKNQSPASTGHDGGNVILPLSDNPTSLVCGKTDPKYCKTDEDCICAGDGMKYPGCFMGNKAYYERCEDKSMSCTDNCQGWGQPPVKCVNNRCSNSYDRTNSSS